MSGAKLLEKLQRERHEARRLETQGWQDRAAGLQPQSTDNAYFHGYCDRIIFEIDRDAALESF